MNDFFFQIMQTSNHRNHVFPLSATRTSFHAAWAIIYKVVVFFFFKNKEAVLVFFFYFSYHRSSRRSNFHQRSGTSGDNRAPPRGRLKVKVENESQKM